MLHCCVILAAVVVMKINHTAASPVAIAAAGAELSSSKYVPIALSPRCKMHQHSGDSFITCNATGVYRVVPLLRCKTFNRYQVPGSLL